MKLESYWYKSSIQVVVCAAAAAANIIVTTADPYVMRM